MKLLKHFNIPALLLLAITMLTLKFGFLDRQEGIILALNQWQYFLLVLAAVLVAAGGFFINSVFGFGKDGNPDVSEAKGYNIYIVLNLAGIGLSYYLSNGLEKPMLLSGLFVLAAATMYVYATGLKQMLIVSNIIVALLIALPVIIVPLFMMFPILTLVPEEVRAQFTLLFRIFIDYTIFTFIIGLILSFVNDLANNDTDYNAGLNTLPILLGRGRTIKIVLGLSVIPVGLVLYYANEYLINLIYALGYVLLFILGLLAYFILKLFSAKATKDFIHLESILKLVLLFTAFSIMVITFNIDYVKH